jgi:polysaccharide biosynthesis transport protein
MNTPNVSNQQLVELAKTYWQWRWVWVSTTAAFSVLGLVYVLFLKSDIWVASQGLIVRDEANGAVMRLGRFQSQTEMKAAQETVLEMARNSSVVHEALATVGREPSWFGLYQSKTPPSPSEIESLAKSGIEVRAPRGAELGTTEVIYLDVKQKSTARAVKLSIALCDALENQLKAVRQARASAVVAELTTARNAAQQSLQEATAVLQKIEAEAGSDLSDLRGLTDSNSGGNTNRQVLDTIKAEIRQVELQKNQLAIDLNLAKESFDNPDHLLVTPSRLVANHAGLRKLREGLADAKIATSGLKGRFFETSPMVHAAVETEGRIRDQLREELGLAVQTLLKDIEVTDQQFNKLQSQQRLLESRLSRLAEIRAEYSNTVSAVRARNQDLQEIERELAQANASLEAAAISSLVTRLDAPIVGESPIGPGRSTILAGVTFGGLFFGLGVVFLLTPLDGKFNYGRRLNDQTRNDSRRVNDVPTPVPSSRSKSSSKQTVDRPAVTSSASVAYGQSKLESVKSTAPTFAALSDSPPSPVSKAAIPPNGTVVSTAESNSEKSQPPREAVQALIMQALKNSSSEQAAATSS